ncbi:hypothetical protein [Streptomyces sp. NPDC047981]|uniref:hypothetical protein n=1 Tax=Streptomyces sp. NPDC047981 TaxID=3154610 RepID=UPI0034210A1A
MTAEPSEDWAVAGSVPALRLVHSVPSISDAAPQSSADGSRRTAGALFAVPQYVAPPLAGATLGSPPSGDTTVTGLGPSAEPGVFGEDELVSAERMAEVVQLAAVGSELAPSAPAAGAAPAGPHERAGLRWFGAVDTHLPLHHVSAAVTRPGEGKDEAGSPASAMTWTPGPPEVSNVLSASGGEAGFDGGTQPGAGTVSFSAGGGGDLPPAGFAFGGGPPGGTGGRGEGPLDQSAELAALLSALPDSRLTLAHLLDEPAVLDRLAGRLYDRILAHVRRELVVERERHGLLTPRG